MCLWWGLLRLTSRNCRLWEMLMQLCTLNLIQVFIFFNRWCWHTHTLLGSFFLFNGPENGFQVRQRVFFAFKNRHLHLSKCRNWQVLPYEQDSRRNSCQVVIKTFHKSKEKRNQIRNHFRRRKDPNLAKALVIKLFTKCWPSCVLETVGDCWWGRRTFSVCVWVGRRLIICVFEVTFLISNQGVGEREEKKEKKVAFVVQLSGSEIRFVVSVHYWRWEISFFLAKEDVNENQIKNSFEEKVGGGWSRASLLCEHEAETPHFWIQNRKSRTQLLFCFTMGNGTHAFMNSFKKLSKLPNGVQGVNGWQNWTN